MLGFGGNSIDPAPESNGAYERVPIRVGQFALVSNSDGEIVFETTDSNICDDGPKVVITITNDNGWSVEHEQGPYHMTIAPSVDLHDERLARRRAFWHAAQFMAGRDLSHRERFSIMHRAGNDSADLFEDDAYFKHGDAVTTDPFGEFLE